MKPGVELLAGIPSVVYGFFGLMIIVPWVRDTFRPYYGGNGLSLFSAALLLGIMILPTIISISESAIRAVPDKYYQGALALGATHERSVFRTVVPAAKSGIMAGIVLGLGHYDCRQSGMDTRQHVSGNPNFDRQYRYGNGICAGSAS